MLTWIAFGWLAVNYAFAAQLVYLAARRDCATRAEALGLAATWPLDLLRGPGCNAPSR